MNWAYLWYLLPGFPKLKIQSGNIALPQTEETKAIRLPEHAWRGTRKAAVHVAFDPPPFRSPPQVVVGLTKFDLHDKSGAHIHRLYVHYDNVRTNGFDLIFETWEDSIVYDAMASWLAYAIEV